MNEELVKTSNEYVKLMDNHWIVNIYDCRTANETCDSAYAKSNSVGMSVFQNQCADAFSPVHLSFNKQQTKSKVGAMLEGTLDTANF